MKTAKFKIYPDSQSRHDYSLSSNVWEAALRRGGEGWGEEEHKENMRYPAIAEMNYGVKAETERSLQAAGSCEIQAQPNPSNFLPLLQTLFGGEGRGEEERDKNTRHFAIQV